MQFANPQEARDFLAAHPQVRSIELMLIDANGIPRGIQQQIDRARPPLATATSRFAAPCPPTG